MYMLTIRTSFAAAHNLVNYQGIAKICMAITGKSR